MKSKQVNDFAQIWLTFLQRKELLKEGLGFKMAASVDPTQSGFLPCSAIDETVASLIFIDLLSILDMVIASHFTNKGTLSNRIRSLNEKALVKDFKSLTALVKRRNAIAHEADIHITQAELDSAIEIVQTQLQAWGLVGMPPNYQRFVSWASNYEESSAKVDLRFVRDYTVGVHIMETHEPVLAYDYMEYANSIENPTFTMCIEKKRSL